MPIYEYLCPRCEHRFEELQRMGEEASPPCEECGCKKTRRQFSTFAMGGSGWGGVGGEGGSGSSCSGCARSSCAGCH